MTALLDSLALHILPTLNTNVGNFCTEGEQVSELNRTPRRSGLIFSPYKNYAPRHNNSAYEKQQGVHNFVNNSSVGATELCLAQSSDLLEGKSGNTVKSGLSGSSGYWSKSNHSNWSEKDPDDLSPNQNAVPFEVQCQQLANLEQQEIRDPRYLSSRQDTHEYSGSSGKTTALSNYTIPTTVHNVNENVFYGAQKHAKHRNLCGSRSL